MDEQTSVYEDTRAISIYTQEEALDDGVLVGVGQINNERMVFTASLFYDGYENDSQRSPIIMKGLQLLSIPDGDDTDHMKLRVIEKDRIWVIHDGNGLTFMKPSDY